MLRRAVVAAGAATLAALVMWLPAALGRGADSFTYLLTMTRTSATHKHVSLVDRSGTPIAMLAVKGKDFTILKVAAKVTGSPPASCSLDADAVVTCIGFSLGTGAVLDLDLTVSGAGKSALFEISGGTPPKYLPTGGFPLEESTAPPVTPGASEEMKVTAKAVRTGNTLAYTLKNRDKVAAAFFRIEPKGFKITKILGRSLSGGGLACKPEPGDVRCDGGPAPGKTATVTLAVSGSGKTLMSHVHSAGDAKAITEEIDILFGANHDVGLELRSSPTLLKVELDSERPYKPAKGQQFPVFKAPIDITVTFAVTNHGPAGSGAELHVGFDAGGSNFWTSTNPNASGDCPHKKKTDLYVDCRWDLLQPGEERIVKISATIPAGDYNSPLQERYSYWSNMVGSLKHSKAIQMYAHVDPPSPDNPDKYPNGANKKIPVSIH